MAAVQYATGKRKSAVARVWLTAGTGDITINARPINNYFGRIALRNLVQMPFDVSGMAGKFSVTEGLNSLSSLLHPLVSPIASSLSSKNIQAFLVCISPSSSSLAYSPPSYLCV